ncbi:MAG: hypothetical protein KZQ83_14980 [gamma proteobacterium symbiont of Taylorina sp.]|nr:hypothetical protein [gamma proteobacterium symbiont of Taylorina sp.]
MAIAFTVLDNTITDGGTSITVNLIDGTTQAGDELFCIITKDDDTPTTTRPSEWTLLQERDSGTMHMELYHKVAVEGDTNSSYTWNGDSETYIAQVIRVTGAETYNTLHYKTAIGDTASIWCYEYSPVDTGTNRAWLHGGGGDNGTMLSVNNDSTSVNIAQNLTGTGSGDVACRLYSKQLGIPPYNYQAYNNSNEKNIVAFVITFYEASATEVLADGNLTSTVSVLSGSGYQAVDGLIPANGNLTSTVSTLSGTAENIAPAFDYVVELFSNISKSTAKLESLRFTMDINDIDYPLIGFTIRSKLVNLGIEISNILEIRVFLSNAEIESLISLIGTATVTIKSIYNFGSTDVETIFFSGVLDDIQKRTLSAWSNVISSNNETSSGSGTHIIDNPILLSTTMARLEFDHTIKPNDYISIDGSNRKANKVTSYNYLEYGAFSEVHYG